MLNINVVNFGIMPRDDSWSVNRLYFKEVNQFSKLNCYESSYTLLVTTVFGLLRMVPLMQIIIFQIDCT